VSPVEELRKASATLLERVAAYRAEAKNNPYWELGYPIGVDNAMGGAGGRLAMLFTPEFAEEAAALLDLVAGRWVVDLNADHHPMRAALQQHALRIARDVNGTSSA
jgi:hypothetical protein